MSLTSIRPLEHRGPRDQTFVSSTNHELLWQEIKVRCRRAARHQRYHCNINSSARLLVSSLLMIFLYYWFCEFLSVSISPRQTVTWFSRQTAPQIRMWYHWTLIDKTAAVCISVELFSIGLLCVGKLLVREVGHRILAAGGALENRNQRNLIGRSIFRGGKAKVF